MTCGLHCIHRGKGFRLTRVDYPARYRSAFHHHDHFGITLVLGGRLEEVVGRERRQVGPGSIVVKPPGTRHANRYGPRGARTLALSIDETFFNSQFSATSLGPWRWLANPALCTSTLRLLGPGNGQTAVATDAVHDLLAALTAVQARGTSPGWLLRVRERIEDEWDDPPSVSALAAGAQVHPVYLTRAFRRHFGCSVSEYRRQLRLARAMDLITGTTRSLADIAQEAGFSDQAHLCREFTPGGMTPGDLRNWGAATRPRA